MIFTLWFDFYIIKNIYSFFVGWFSVAFSSTATAEGWLGLSVTQENLSIYILFSLQQTKTKNQKRNLLIIKLIIQQINIWNYKIFTKKYWDILLIAQSTFKYD